MTYNVFGGTLNLTHQPATALITISTFNINMYKLAVWLSDYMSILVCCIAACDV